MRDPGKALAGLIAAKSHLERAIVDIGHDERDFELRWQVGGAIRETARALEDVRRALADGGL